MKEEKEKLNIQKSEMVVGATSKKDQYSTHFSKNFNVDGSPSSVTLESIFNSPQDNIEEIVGYAKYCYRKYGIIMRVINITRDFGCSGLELSYPTRNKKIRQVIEDYNERIDIEQLVKDFIYEISLTGNLACYDRDGQRVDIYPINTIQPVPLIKNNKQLIAYKIPLSTYTTETYGDEIDKQISGAYPEEIVKAIKESKDKVILNPEKSYFAKINASQYEPYGLSIILPAFEDLAHKSLLKEAEKATANDIIDKIMLVKIGDSENVPNKALIEQYTTLLDGLSGSVRLTVPYYVSAEYVEPETSVFESEKFTEVDTDILNTLGISLSLIRGESGGNYSEGIINFSGLVRTIQNIQKPIVKIINGLYAAELKRNGFKPEDAPKVKFSEVVIDKQAKLELVKELFNSAGLPYRVLYEEFGYDFDSLKLIREDENEQDMDETFKIHTMPFSGNVEGNGDGNSDETEEENKGGAPKKSVTQRKSDGSSSNNSQPRTGVNKGNTNRSAKK